MKEFKEVPIVRYVYSDNEHQNGYCTFVHCSKAQYKLRDDSKIEMNIVGDYNPFFELIAQKWLYEKYNIKRCNLCKFYYATTYESHASCRLSKKYGTPKYPQMKTAEKCRSFNIGRFEWCYKVSITEIREVSPNKKEPFKVIVAGSSGFYDYDLFKKKCDYFLSSKISKCDVSILFGTARDTRKMIERYCEERDLPFEPFDAEWNQYGQGAPRHCAETMLKFANAAIVFWDGESIHTKYMIEAAKRKGIRVAVVKVDVEPGSQMYLNL